MSCDGGGGALGPAGGAAGVGAKGADAEGRVKFYLKPQTLWKWAKKQKKCAHGLVQRACVLSRPGEEQDVNNKFKQLYKSPNNWILRFDASVEAQCPGT